MKEIILNAINTNVYLEKMTGLIPTVQEINTFESMLGYQLPIDFKEFLLKYNGGTCELKNEIVGFGDRLCDLYGLLPHSFSQSHMQLMVPEQLQDLWQGLPNSILPIGESESGTMIAIQFLNDKSNIVVIDHEDEDFIPLLHYPNFTQFLINTKRE